MTCSHPVFVAFLCVAMALQATAQEVDPSRFGSWDQSGASVLMTESKAIEAANLIRRGRVVPIGRAYSPGTQVAGEQQFTLSGTDMPSHQAGNAVFMQSGMNGSLEQVGTRLNGLGHVGVSGEDIYFYNGHQISDVKGENGLKALGVEQLKPFFTRGIMIDMVTVRGRPMEAGDEITVSDIETALDWQELAEPRAGDVVIFHTGWGRHWRADTDTYLSGAPGIGMDAAAWLIERGVAIVGADTWSVEVQAVSGERQFPVHLEFIPKHGIFLHENLETERLIDAEISEFAFIFAPLEIVGATGSPGEPLAVY